ncbi:MAG: response regulator with CheY-like receiver, AAA-type ATPase, and DNA-binding domain [Bacteroidota bacterium]|jgi:serine phosphatase RsbU (regulator of sigma subunit)|nr:response regulator with CheY-like receiver, AAA-type ATPase, and DNA-binding domain [Bacteroidota bacterium]
MLSCLFSQAQNTPFFHLDSLHSKDKSSYNEPGVPLELSWRYHKGDDKQWADNAFNDSSWEFLEPLMDLKSIPEKTFEGIGWFRLHIVLDSALIDSNLALMVTQNGASEIYLDGKLIHKFGKINRDSTLLEEHYDPQEVPVDIRFEKTRSHVLAVRYSDSKAIYNHKNNLAHTSGFSMKIGLLRDSIFQKYSGSNITTGIFIFYFTFFLALSFLHFMFFIFYRANRSNLYYSIFAAAFGTVFIFIIIQKNFTIPDFILTTRHLFGFLPDIYIPALLAMLYTIFNSRIPKIFWIWMILFVTDFILNLFHTEIPYLGYVIYALFVVESLRIIITAIIQKREGSWIIGSGIIVTVIFFTLFFVLSALGEINFSANGWKGLIIGLLVIYATLSIPLSMTVYLARDFAKTSRDLSKKLVEVETLSARSIEQEKEKQKILETQKEMLEAQVVERTFKISEQKKLIEEKNKDITDSINYAKRIQDAILPAKELKYKIFSNAFVLFKPKDIVSGDFYWFAEKDGKRLIAACDCTGHGVPGALMSMIGNNILNQIVVESGITATDKILELLNKEIRKALKQDGFEATKDGMDIALLCFNSDSEIEYSGAQRPLWIVHNNEIKEIKADKQSIGGLQNETEKTFNKHIVHLQKGDSIYIFSDGYVDQFGGTEGKKFMSKQLKSILLNIHHLPILQQEKFLDDTIENWKSDKEQIDDILVIGIKI